MKITATITNRGVKREVDFQGAILPDGRSIQGILDENETLKEQILKINTENVVSKQRIIELLNESEISKQQIAELNDEKSLLARYIHKKTIRKILEWLLRIFAFVGAIGTIAWILSLSHF